MGAEPGRFQKSDRVGLVLLHVYAIVTFSIMSGGSVLALGIMPSCLMVWSLPDHQKPLLLFIVIVDTFVDTLNPKMLSELLTSTTELVGNTVDSLPNLIQSNNNNDGRSCPD